MLSGNRFKGMMAPWSRSGKAVSFGTWHAHALLSVRPRTCRAKAKLLVDTLAGGSGKANVVWALQEVHGSRQQFSEVHRWVDRNFLIFGSFAQSAIGGVVTLFPKYRASVLAFSCDEVIPGRCLRVCFEEAGHTFVHWNMHTHDFQRDMMDGALSLLQCDIRHAASDPLHFTVLVVGDFNFTALGDVPTCLSTPANAANRSPAPHSSSPWSATPDSMIELKHQSGTHFHSATDSSS